MWSQGHVCATWPNNGSYCSDNPDDTELMMDELLMAPPITGAVLRGLLPRRTLEPLIEEDFSDTSSSSTSSDPISPQSNSSEQDSRSGSAADTCSRDVVDRARNDRTIVEPSRSSSSRTTSPEENAQHSCRASVCHTTTSQSLLSSEWEEAQKVCENGEGCCVEVNDSHPSPTMPRSESYRKIVEAAEDAISATTEPDSNQMMAASSSNTVLLFDRFRPAARFVNIERVPRTRSIRIFEFFNVRRTERRIYERYPENRHLMKTFSQENDVPTAYSPSKIPVKDNKDNRNGRFWRQLSRRRTIDKSTNAA